MHCSERSDVPGLGRLVYTYDLILNNEPGKVTLLNRRKNTSIIDLKFPTYDIGVLDT